MSRRFNTARRIDYLLKPFPGLRRKLETIATKYHHHQENWDYDHDHNGERWILQTLAAHGHLNTVFDVGANQGNWTDMVIEANPQAEVHSFEICPPVFQKFSARLSDPKWKSKKIKANPFGLADARGILKLNYVAEGDEGSTLFEVQNGQKSELIDVQVEAGKDYCREHGVAAIDLLKLDVEGAEQLVLRGFDDLLVPAKIPIIQYEYGLINIITKFLLRDSYAYFESRGYKVGKLMQNSVRFRDYRYQDEDFLGPNYVAVRPDLVPLLAKPAGS